MNKAEGPERSADSSSLCAWISRAEAQVQKVSILKRNVVQYFVGSRHDIHNSHVRELLISRECGDLSLPSSPRHITDSIYTATEVIVF